MKSDTGTPLRILVLSRAYPNEIQPQFGLWVERLVQHTAGPCEPIVVAPVPYCPPLPRAVEYTRFRRIPHRDQRAGIKVYHPRFVVGPSHSLHSYEGDCYTLGVWALVDRLHREKPFDLIHAHFTYPDGVAAARLGRRYSVPVVITEHALWTNWMDRYPRVRRQAVWASQQSTWHLAVSSAGRDTIARYAGSSERLQVLPIGVDGSMFKPGNRSQRNRNQILFVGFINFNKGVDVLLRAMVQLRERRPEVRLVLAGGAIYRNTRLQGDQIRQMAIDLGLGDAVTFAGMQKPESVAALMRESAVLVLPSRRESFGAVLVEALASGTPIVATRCGGPEDIINRDVGLLVPLEQPDTLASALEQVLTTDYDPSRLAAYAADHFGWDQIAARLVVLYRRAIAGTGPHPVRAGDWTRESGAERFSLTEPDIDERES